MIGQTCYLYVIQVASGPVKIGIAQDVDARLPTLQTANFEELHIVYSFQCLSMEHASALEMVLHRRYCEQRLRGEWFNVQPANVVTDIEFAAQFVGAVTRIEIKRYKYVTPSYKPMKQTSERRARQAATRQIVIKHLEAHPEDITANARDLAARLEVGKSTVYSVLAEMRG